MCGIVGIDFKTDKKVETLLKHRGPDYFGIYSDEYINLYHSRLSIIDLTDGANQPFIYKNLVLVFNGEIYNYKELKKELKEYIFTTSSDSEVLLYSYHKWGRNCLDKLNGDFSFCVYDKIAKQLFCARDRVGNKPFYYYNKNNQFIFASEIKVFTNYIELDFDTQKLGDSILFSLNDNEKNTIYKDIYNLEPASFLEYDLLSKNLSIQKYWDIKNENENQPYDKKDFQEKLEAFEELFEDAVKLRLISDVKLGSMLSGGVDSSLIAYFTQKHNKDVDFFSVVYDEFKTIDESKFIKIMEKKFALKVNYLKPTFEDLKEDIKDLIRTQDDIFRSLSIYAQYYLFKMASLDVKVMLSGQGADELFGGYSSHIARFLVKNKEEFLHRVQIYGNQALDEMKMGIKLNLPEELKYKLLNEDNKTNLVKLQESLRGYKPNYDGLLDKFDSSFSNTLIKDTCKNNIPMLLRFEDRNAMRFSLENRTPFTDFRVIEFAHSLPDSYKLRYGYSKHFLREFASRYIPKEICYRIDKNGFEAPERDWIKRLGLGENIFDFRLSLYEELLNV